MRSFIVLASVFVVALAAPKTLPNIGIVGGKDADIADYPYQISIEAEVHICGGSIIGPKWIVTAAHCTQGYNVSQLSIRAGSSIRETGGQVIQVSKINDNPNFNTATVDYDFSILELEEDITIENAKSIDLPKENAEIKTGVDCVITGWGSTSDPLGPRSHQLQVATVPTVSTEICKSAYGAWSITDRMFCAGLMEGGKDSCEGDSGGPLVINGQLIGVISWGNKCAQPNYPGVYASVPALRSFITEITGI